MSTLRTNTLQDASGSNSVPMATVAAGTAKAWVNFNGTGVVSIRASFNVASITDNGVGDHTVNFSNALTDANYSCVASCGLQEGFAPSCCPNTFFSTSIRVYVYADAQAYSDRTYVNVACFR